MGALNEKETTFLTFLHDIYEGRVETHWQVQERVPAAPSDWRDIASNLLDASVNGGQELFWTSYDAMASLYHPLNAWRTFITNPPMQQKPTPVQRPTARVATADAANETPPVQHAERSSDAQAYTLPFGKPYSQVVRKDIDWLWEQRIALGKLAIIDGDPGQGKSMLTVDLAARVSRGWSMPDGTPGIAGGAGVILITPEDDMDDTIVARLQRAGADMRRVFDLSTVPVRKSVTEEGYERDFMIAEDLARLEEMIDYTQAKLVVIDPIMAVLSNQDVYRDPEVRAMLSPLRKVLKKMQVAGLMVRHLNKGGSSNVLYRGGGSIAFIGSVRTGMMVAKDPYDAKKSLLVHVKTNIGDMGPTLSFSVEKDTRGDAYVSWHGTRDYTWKEIFSPSSEAANATEGSNKPSTARKQIMQVLEEHAPDALSPLEISNELPDVLFNTVRVTLARMSKEGAIEQSERGKYSVCAV
jgi:hypothetical protein